MVKIKIYEQDAEIIEYLADTYKISVAEMVKRIVNFYQDPNKYHFPNKDFWEL